jgi:hypothetical protein
MKKLVSLSTFLFLVAAVTAVTFVGSVVAYVSMASSIDYEQIKIGEVKPKLLATVNETISPYNLNFTTTCEGMQTIRANLKYVSTGFNRTRTLELNGTTVFPEPIDPGDIYLEVIGMQQGKFNCTLQPIASNETIIEFY